jgi:DNA-directed RNA polymerase subunit K
LDLEEYTRYERARIVGARALQIAMGAPVLIQDAKGEPIDIALEELRRGVIPITVKRELRVYKKAVKSMAEQPESVEEDKMMQEISEVQQ